MAKDEPKVVEATGTASGTQYASEVEKVMADAIKDCTAKGITDPEKIKAAMLKARAEYTGRPPPK